VACEVKTIPEMTTSELLEADRQAGNILDSDRIRSAGKTFTLQHRARIRAELERRKAAAEAYEESRRPTDW
jgi:hypothetical protein